MKCSLLRALLRALSLLKALQAPSKNPSKKHLLLKNLLVTLLRSVLLHDPLGVRLQQSGLKSPSHGGFRLIQGRGEKAPTPTLLTWRAFWPPKKIFSPPPPQFPKFPADTLPAPSPPPTPSWETPISWDFQKKKKTTPPPSCRPGLPLLLPGAEKNKKYPKRPPSQPFQENGPFYGGRISSLLRTQMALQRGILWQNRQVRAL